MIQNILTDSDVGKAVKGPILGRFGKSHRTLITTVQGLSQQKRYSE